jgi:hypothetical protein
VVGLTLACENGEGFVLVRMRERLLTGVEAVGVVFLGEADEEGEGEDVCDVLSFGLDFVGVVLGGTVVAIVVVIGSGLMEAVSVASFLLLVFVVVLLGVVLTRNLVSGTFLVETEGFLLLIVNLSMLV